MVWCVCGLLVGEWVCYSLGLFSVCYGVGLVYFSGLFFMVGIWYYDGKCWVWKVWVWACVTCVGWVVYSCAGWGADWVCVDVLTGWVWVLVVLVVTLVLVCLAWYVCAILAPYLCC